MDISITESTAGPVVIEDGSTDNSPDLFSQDEMNESLLEVTIQSERIANKTDTKKETPKITRKAETNTNKQVTPIQSTKHLTEQQIEQQITQQIDQEVAQLVEQKESSKSPPTADTKKNVFTRRGYHHGSR